MLKLRRLRRTIARLIQTCDEAIHDFELPVFVRAWLLVQRMPAIDKALLEVAGVTPMLYATWEGKRVRLTMASRFGDVGITTKVDPGPDEDPSDSYEHRVMLFELSEWSGSKIVCVTPDEAHLIAESLNSHIYWQLSDDHYRNSGYVMEPGSDDEEKAAEIQQAEALQARFE